MKVLSLKTWKRTNDGLPQDHPLSCALSVAENPNRKGMLFAVYVMHDSTPLEQADQLVAEV